MPIKTNEHAFQDIFLQDDFSVDAFLQTYSGTYTLEDLRDKLCTHLKHIEYKMIDIVNSESETILSLSSSLNGLDEKINYLISSFGQLKEKTLDVHTTIVSSIENIEKITATKKEIINEKERYKNVLNALECCSKVHRILNEDVTKPVSSQVLLRAVDQFILQELYLQSVGRNMFMTSELRNLNKSSEIVMSHLKETFMSALNTNNIEEIVYCLKIGEYLNEEKLIESLVEKQLISSKLNQIMNEKMLKDIGLHEIYNKVLIIIEKNMAELLKLTVPGNEYGITGYNFILNSIWPQVDEKLKVNLISIFSPGNPAVFQQNFIETMNFIGKMLTQFNKSDTENLYDNPSLKNHMQKWNLPVYFQIRFNEIARILEKSLMEDSWEFIDENDFKLKASSTLWNCVCYTLSKNVFIDIIAYKFWELVLQLIARYLSWVNTSLTATQTENETYDLKVNFLLYLLLDVKNLSSKLPSLDLKMFPGKIQDIARKNINDCSMKLIDKLASIENSVIDTISKKSSAALKQISHIPRLYRKTNKSVPTEPAKYVLAVLEPPLTFLQIQGPSVLPDICDKLMEGVCSRIADEYYDMVNEILTQVQKTEDSLRRLKKSRSSQTDPVSVGDDQKIKIQLDLDVTYFCKEVVKITSGVNLTKLTTLLKH